MWINMEEEEEEGAAVIPFSSVPAPWFSAHLLHIPQHTSFMVAALYICVYVPLMLDEISDLFAYNSTSFRNQLQP